MKLYAKMNKFDKKILPDAGLYNLLFLCFSLGPTRTNWKGRQEGTTGTQGIISNIFLVWLLIKS